MMIDFTEESHFKTKICTILAIAAKVKEYSFAKFILAAAFVMS